jgi:gamma-glutamylcyclotransferase (GGCT)/AIG2-like uncharacterized protein YtfP
MHLFVYGTLKRGERRHQFLAGQEFVAVVHTRPLYRLFNLGEYPGLVGRENGLPIEGELWDVDDDCLKQLDQVEGCDVGLYLRGPVELAQPHDALHPATYFYAQSVDGLADCGTRW